MATTTIKKTHQTLNILMNGHHVGALKKNTQDKLNFTYTKTWLDTPGARPISLSLPLLNKPFKTPVVQHFFEHLLPDDANIKSRLQAQFKTKSNHAFDLLSAVGRECMGALQCIPGRIPAFSQKIRFEALTDKTIATRLKDPKKYPLGLAAGLDTFCHTLPGSQDKAAFLYHQDTWARPRDKTPTSHILKLANTESGELENEWMCLKIAEAFGLPVAKSHLLHFEEIQALAIKRFDRQYASDKSWLMRLPQETIAQALGIAPGLKYAKDGGPGVKQVMRFLMGSTTPIHDRDVFYCSQILFWLLAATDGHAKNFSVFIKPEGKYQLTPLYDISSSYPRIASNQLTPEDLHMAMPLHTKTRTTHWHQIKRQHFLETAKATHYSVDRAAAILDDMLARVDAVVDSVSSNLPLNFPKGVSEPIFQGMQFVKQKLSAKTKVL